MDGPGDPAPTNVLRVSTHIYNSKQEIDDLLGALRCVLRELGGPMQE